MPNEALTDTQVRETRQIAKLEVHTYFDYYLEHVLPRQQKAAREHTHLMIEAHDADDRSHGGVEARVNRFRWAAMGWLATGGVGGAGLLKLISSLAG